MHINEGQKLGHYRIVSELGRGGMGVVYRAEHEIIGNHVAVKVLGPAHCQDPEIVERFQREARAAGGIGHPGIVQVQDFGWSSCGRAFIVMELLAGEDLLARLERVGRLSRERALVFGLQIASALAAAHGKNIIHRDLKPDNVMIVRDPDIDGGERIKLLDFGVAKLERDDGTQTRAGLLLGTPRYMAPEQCWGERIDGRADLYSLGCVLYHALCGRPPFTSDGARELVAAQTHSPVPPPSRFNPEIGQRVEQLILDLLAKEPERRIRSAVKLMKRLEVLLDLERDGESPTIEASSLEATIPFTRDLESLSARSVTPHRAGSLRSDGPNVAGETASHFRSPKPASTARGTGSAPSGFRTEPARPISRSPESAPPASAHAGPWTPTRVVARDGRDAWRAARSSGPHPRLPLPDHPPRRRPPTSDDLQLDASIIDRPGTISQLASVRPIYGPPASPRRSWYRHAAAAIAIVAAAGLGVQLAVGTRAHNSEFAAADGPENTSVPTDVSPDGGSNQDSGPSVPHVRQADTTESALEPRDASPAEQDAASRVLVVIETEPAGAEIRDSDGDVVGVTPFSQRVARDDETLRWELTAPGYEPVPIEVTTGEDFIGQFQLTRVPPPSPRRQARKRTRSRGGDEGALVNPFR